MIPPLNVSRDARAIVFGAAAIVTILAVGRGGPKVARWQEREVRETVVAREQRIREVAFAARLPSLRAQSRRLAQLELRLDSAEITAANRVGAGAALMSAVTDMADGTGVEISSARLDDRAVQQPSVPRATIDITANGGLEDLVVFLSILEAGPPAVEVTSLSIAPGAAPGIGAGGTLQAALTVEALVRPMVR